MYYEVTSPSANTAVSLAQAKSFLRLTDNSQDNLLEKILIPALTQVVEDMMGKSFITKTIDVYYDKFPESELSPIILPLSPIQEITSVKYQASDGTEKTYSTSNYIAIKKSNPAKIALKENCTYPSDCKTQANAVKITAIVGFADTEVDIPQHHKLHLLYMLSHAWTNRGLISSQSVNEIAVTLKNILEPYRMINL